MKHKFLNLELGDSMHEKSNLRNPNLCWSFRGADLDLPPPCIHWRSLGILLHHIHPPAPQPCNPNAEVAHFPVDFPTFGKGWGEWPPHVFLPRHFRCLFLNEIWVGAPYWSNETLPNKFTNRNIVVHNPIYNPLPMPTSGHQSKHLRSFLSAFQWIISQKFLPVGMLCWC